MARADNLKLAYVTTFEESKLNLYGQRCISSLCDQVEEQVFLVTDSGFNLDVYYKNLNMIENEYSDHLNKVYLNFTKTSDFTFSPNRFCFKTSSIVTVKNQISPDYDFLVWIDADSVVRKPGFTDFIVKNLLPDNAQIASFFDRNSSYGYCETGLVVFNLRHPCCGQFIDSWNEPFASSSILNFAEWHDAFLFSHLVRTFKPGTFRYLCKDYGLKTSHPIFEFKRLRKHFEHLKGDTRKHLGFSPEKYGINPMYFRVLYRLIRSLKGGPPRW